MYEKINNWIWNAVAILSLMVVGYALAMAQVAYREEEDPPVQEIVVTPCPATPRRQCDFKYAINALKAAQEALNTKAIQATPQSAKAAYRGCQEVLNEAILMMDHPNDTLLN